MQLPEPTRYFPLLRLPAATYVRQLPWTLALLGVIMLAHLVPQGHDAQRLLELALLLLFAAAMLLAMGRQRWAGWQDGGAARGFLLAFFALGTLSSLRAFSPSHAWYEQGSLFLLLMLGIRVGHEITHDCARHLLAVLRVCGVGCALYSCKVLIVLACALLSGLPPTVDDFAPGFSNFRFLNHAQTITLPLLALLIVLDRPAGEARALWWWLAGFWWALLIMLTGRGTVAGLLAGTALAWLLRRNHAYPFCRTLWLTALLGGIMYALLFLVLPVLCGMEPFGMLTGVAERGVANPTSGRLDLWRAAWELLGDHVWLGVGPLHFAHYANLEHTHAHPHNWMLQIAVEWGVPALLCLCCALASALLRLLKTAAQIASDDARNQTVLAAWIVIGGAILADGMLSGLIVMPVSQLLIALYIGCASGWALSLRPAAAVGASMPGRVLLGVLLAAAMGALLYQLWMAARPDGVGGHRAAPLNNTVFPRLWRDGYF